MPKLLIAGAHPDDETFFAGGTLAKYASEGAHVAVVCATRGERGGTAGLCSIGELPKVRERELTAAMRALGVEDLTFLPYEDQKLAEAPVEEMRRHLVKALRRVRPEVVITFDPQGANGHTDHVAISRYTSDAVTAAADARWCPELGAPHQTARLLWQAPVPLWEIGTDADLREQPGFDFLIDVGAFAARKEAALRAHATQVPALGRIFFEHPNRARMFATEPFRMGWGARPARVPATDLFAM